MSDQAVSIFNPLDQERVKLLSNYHAQDHLAKWLAYDKNRGKQVEVLYYPAAWRLYELSLRYAEANFSIEIVHLDAEKDFVVVKARLYLGISYETSPKKAEAFKQGKLTELDRIETKAKARAARDFGIGTEHALDMDDLEAGAVEGSVEESREGQNNSSKVRVVNADKTAKEPSIEELKTLCDEVVGVQNWQKVLVNVLGEEVGDIPEEMLNRAHKLRIHNALLARQRKNQQKAS